MQEEIIVNSSIKKNIIKHGLVIITFLILTTILTFPVILDFTTEAAGAGCFDKCHMMWRMWWAGFAFENNLDFYHSQHIFQPDGVSISGNLAQFTTGIGAILHNVLGDSLTWNIIWLSSFIFGGYGAFLLAEYFTRNTYASIVAGIIFTFSTYHIVHSQFHIGLSMIVWLPLFILVLFKILNNNSKVLIVLGSLFLFLASITHLYFFAMLIIFSIIFFVINIFKQKNVTNKKFITNFLLILGIGVISSLLMFLPILNSGLEYENKTLDEHVMFSGGLANLVMPTIYHSSQMYTDYWLMGEMYYWLNEDTQIIPSIEGYTYLGYSIIFLSILSLIFKTKFSWFWVLSGVGFALLSFGPELKIINNLTGILMPGQILFDFVPGWDEFRSSGRFIIMTHLSLAILSAFALNGIMKSKILPKKILLLVVIGITAVVICDVSAIPYPSFTEEIPKVYKDIKNDESDFVVFETPVGNMGCDDCLYTHPSIQYYQTFHEKPIIGGYESRATIEQLTQTETYFLKNFQMHSDENDIIKQSLGESGISILNYFNIKYVIIHKEEVHSMSDQSTMRLPHEASFISRTSSIMSEIMSSDQAYFEDEKLIVYKIPKSDNLEPFLLLGNGWHKFDSSEKLRIMYPKSNIKIINPGNNEVEYSLKIDLVGYEQNRHVEIFFNKNYLEEYNIGSATATRLELNGLMLSPGENIISIKSDGYKMMPDKNIGSDVKISLIGFSISGE